MSQFPSDFISGAIAAGNVVIGVLFLKFWRRTGDPLFQIFAGAFWLFAANQTVFAISDTGREQGWSYLLRLAAFSLIIIGIVSKNLGTRRR